MLLPCMILLCLSLDLIVTYFPRRVSLSVMGVVVLLLLWNIYNHTFVRTDCERYKLRWGIFGEEISYCTIYRIIFQTILSLMFSSFVAIFRGRTDNLFFCNANIYRGTGTPDRQRINDEYVDGLKSERENSFKRRIVRSDDVEMDVIG